ncbi:MULTISPECIES: acyl carrier protein [Pseudomonas]|jgi:acyl carrier protein|uniref:MacpB n=2 Tax=Pseudomonas fluorescens group TaxID=136843 RepID=Q8RL67_PSEFL|nr:MULTISPECIES: acyl carrier protein [Pseudomonas]AAM12918.1 MacpB [Pseudomonas fluorescens]KFF43099.1 hypothetical protein JH25_04720 [Pseudomonas sp. BRG-100]MBY8972062.1 acyl carrier protein [Pseudomonas sp. P867]MCK3826255.1 acyl carrier protein [Pseudomonas sp. W2Aug9]MCK3829866.1 acyl carrier protein [Pseudomonas fluorescens]
MEINVAQQTVSESIRELKLPGWETASIETETHLQGELGIDSLHKLILLTRLQERSNFQFAQLNNEAYKFDTVGDLVNLLVAHG